MYISDHPRKDIKSVKVFVAMPGSNFGKNAFYDTPELVRDNLLIPVCERVAMILSIDPKCIELKIEKDKTKGGDIYMSMYREAVEADVYIADLTGANPNVYLELGVRWAFRESVTIPIVQNPDDLRFNVSKARVRPYTPKSIQKDIKDIAETICSGLIEQHLDSPILSSTDLVWISRKEKDELEKQIQLARQSETEALLEKANKLENQIEKITILKKACARNPASSKAALYLGVAFREAGDFRASEKTLLQAVKIDPLNPVANRELGVTLSKIGKSTEAIEYLKTALRLNAKDVETYNNLGGALRRIAEESPGRWNVRDLKEAYHCYENAMRLNRFDIYAALNVARTGLILSCWEDGFRESAKLMFEQQIHLANYIISLEPGNPWRLLDLADCYLFTGDFMQAELKINDAINRMQPEQRKNILTSYVKPIKALLSLNVLDSDTKGFAQKLLDNLS